MNSARFFGGEAGLTTRSSPAVVSCVIGVKLLTA